MLRLALFTASFIFISYSIFGQSTEVKEEISIEDLAENHSSILDNIEEIAFNVTKGESKNVSYIKDEEKILAAIRAIAELESSNSDERGKGDRALLLINKKQIAHFVPHNLSCTFLNNDSITISSDAQQAVIAIDGSASTWSKLVVEDLEYEATINQILNLDVNFIYAVRKNVKKIASLTFIDSLNQVKQIQADSFWLDITLDQAKQRYPTKEEFQSALKEIGEIGLILGAILNSKMIYSEFKVTSWVEIAHDQYEVDVEIVGDLQREKDTDNFFIKSIVPSNEYEINVLMKD